MVAAPFPIDGRTIWLFHGLAVGDVTSDSLPELIEVMLSADREFYIGIAAWNTYGSTISYTISEGAAGRTLLRKKVKT